MTGLLKGFIYRQMNRRKTDLNDRQDEYRKNVIESAKAARAEVKVRIENMVAQLDTCGDRWFLRPKQTIDECFTDQEEEEKMERRSLKNAH